MTYQSNIPLPTDLISVSQGDLKNNFTSLQNTYNVDHFGFNPEANIGFHKHVTLPDQTSAAPAPAAGFGAEYAKTVNSETYPFWRRDGLTTDYPMMPIKAFALFPSANPPTSVFPLPYGNISSITFSTPGVYNITFVTPFANTNYSAICTSEGQSAFIPQLVGATKTVNNCQIVVGPSNGTTPADTGFKIMVAFFS